MVNCQQKLRQITLFPTNFQSSDPVEILTNLSTKTNFLWYPKESILFFGNISSSLKISGHNICYIAKMTNNGKCIHIPANTLLTSICNTININTDIDAKIPLYKFNKFNKHNDWENLFETLEFFSF